MTIKLWTPTTILECVTHDDDTPVDCFDDAVPSDNPYRQTMVEMLWAQYRYTPIGSACLDRWLQRVKDKAAILDKRYQLLIAEWEADKESIASIQRASKDLRSDVTTQSTSGSDVITSEHEDLPQSEDASGTRWLSARDTSTSAPGVTTTVDSESEATHTEATLGAEEYDKVLRMLKSPYVAYVDEFSNLFLDYFSLNGGCCDCL